MSLFVSLLPFLEHPFPKFDIVTTRWARKKSSKLWAIPPDLLLSRLHLLLATRRKLLSENLTCISFRHWRFSISYHFLTAAMSQMPVLRVWWMIYTWAGINISPALHCISLAVGQRFALVEFMGITSIRCTLRNSLQYRSQANLAQSMASDVDSSLGCGCNIDGSYTKSSRVLGGQILPRSCRKRIVSRNRVLSLNVVHTLFPT